MPDNEIIQLIEKIRERYKRIYGPTGNTIRIETDLILADIRELYEKMSSLPKVDTLETMHEQQLKEVSIQLNEEPVHVESVPIPGSSSSENAESKSLKTAAEPVFEFVPAQEKIFTEPIVEMISEEETSDELHTATVLSAAGPALTDPVINIPSFTHDELHGKTTSSNHGLDLFGAPLPTLADKLGEEKRSVNERLNSEANVDKRLGSKLRQPVTDLKSAIGINDRFHFINELFEGDMRVYDEMLTSLNTCASLRDALSIFENTKISRGWNTELESVNKLLDFIHRRYA
jgi:hypothetical protein